MVRFSELVVGLKRIQKRQSGFNRDKRDAWDEKPTTKHFLVLSPVSPSSLFE
jgi:hypothetical protein